MAFRYRKTLYKFNVLECIDTDGKSQETVCVQVKVYPFTVVVVLLYWTKGQAAS